LTADSHRFCKDLSAFLNIDTEETLHLLQKSHENKGVAKAFNSYRKARALAIPLIQRAAFLKPLARHIDQKLLSKLRTFGNKDEAPISPMESQAIHERYAQGNAELEIITGYPLRDLGYPSE